MSIIICFHQIFAQMAPLESESQLCSLDKYYKHTLSLVQLVRSQFISNNF